MNRTASLLLALCLGAASAFPAAADDKSAVATASALLDRLDAGDYAAATADFNAQMKAGLSATQLAGVQAQLEAAGPVQSRGEPQVSQRDGNTLVVYRIQRAQGAIEALVAIDAAGQVAGLYFSPAKDDQQAR